MTNDAAQQFHGLALTNAARRPLAPILHAIASHMVCWQSAGFERRGRLLLRPFVTVAKPREADAPVRVFGVTESYLPRHVSDYNSVRFPV